MLVYDVLRKLGLEVEIRPIPRQQDIDNYAEEDERFNATFEKYANSKYGPLEILGENLKFQAGGLIDECDGAQGLLDTWGKYGLKHVTWLNGKDKAKHDLAMAYAAISNCCRL